jgi:hypothetical protein
MLGRDTPARLMNRKFRRALQILGGALAAMLDSKGTKLA